MSEPRTLSLVSISTPIIALLILAGIQVTAVAVYLQFLGPPPVVQFSANQTLPLDRILREGYGGEATTYVVTVTVRPPPKDQLAIQLQYEGEAKLPTDLEGPTQIILQPNAHTCDFPLSIICNKDNESPKKLNLVLQGSNHARIGTQNALALTIADALPLEEPKSLKFSVAPSAREDDGELYIEVEMERASPIDREFKLRLSGTATDSDHDLGSTPQVAIEAGERIGRKHFRLIDNNQPDKERSLSVALASDDEVRDTLKILDDESIPIGVRVRIEPAEIVEGKTATLIAEFVDPAYRSNEDIVIQLSSVGTAQSSGVDTEHSDFSFSQDVKLVLRKSEKSARLNLPVALDGRYEGDESLKISCTTSHARVSFKQGQIAEAVIKDQDSRPKLVFARSPLVVSEADKEVVITVKLEGSEAVAPIKFNFRADAPSEMTSAAIDQVDYQFPSGSLTIQPGKRSVDLKLIILNDQLREPNPPLAGPPTTDVDATYSQEHLRIVLTQEGEQPVSLPVSIKDDDYWEGDLLLIVPITNEFMESPDLVIAKVEQLLYSSELNGNESHQIAGGIPWLVFPKSEGKSLQPWIPERGADGKLHLNPEDIAKAMKDRVPFDTSGKGAEQLKAAVHAAISAADMIRKRKPQKLLAITLLEASTGISLVPDQFTLEAKENKDANFLLAMPNGSQGAWNRFEQQCQDKCFKGALTLPQGDSALITVQSVLKGFRLKPNSP